MWSTELADKRDRPRSSPAAGIGGARGTGAAPESPQMHTIVVFTSRPQHEAVFGAWLADAVRRGEKVLVLRAPGEDVSVLDRSLAAVDLDPSGVVGSGQVEVLDITRWRAQFGGEVKRLYELYLGQVWRAGRDGFPGVA